MSEYVRIDSLDTNRTIPHDTTSSKILQELENIKKDIHALTEAINETRDHVQALLDMAHLRGKYPLSPPVEEVIPPTGRDSIDISSNTAGIFHVSYPPPESTIQGPLLMMSLTPIGETPQLSPPHQE